MEISGLERHYDMASGVVKALDGIDLEIEKINAILDKIQADPETEDVKRVEIELWQRIREKALEGRRTGVGITAGDASVQCHNL